METAAGSRVRRFFVQRMKTKWGCCSPRSMSIRLNTELAKKPHACLEYLVVHQMAHLLESTHNERFVAILNEHQPQWRIRRDALDRLPMRKEHWIC